MSLLTAARIAARARILRRLLCDRNLHRIELAWNGLRRCTICGRFEGEQ